MGVGETIPGGPMVEEVGGPCRREEREEGESFLHFTSMY